MRRGWTIFNRILMWLSIGLGILVVSIVTKVVNENPLFDWLPGVIAVGGILIVFIFHAFWGMFIDISSNITDLPTKEDLDNLSNLLAHKTDNSDHINKLSNITPINKIDSSELINKLSNIDPINKIDNSDHTNKPNDINKKAEIQWTCPNCGRSNYININACSGCGEPRYIRKPNPTENPDIEPWTCSACGRTNHTNPDFCSACKTPKNYKSGMGPADQEWTCPDCGMINHINCDFCTKCKVRRKNDLFGETDKTNNSEIKN